MKNLLESRIVKKVANIPVVWNIAQNLIGSYQWKAQMYPSVFEHKKGTLLDFGCSSGNTTGMFLDFNYFGVDVDQQAIQAAQSKFKQYPNVQFFNLDINTRAFKKEFFDHVLFAGTAHHLTDNDLGKTIDTLMENLKPGGQLHFFDHISQPAKDGWMTRFILRSDQGKHPRTEETYKHFFDPEKYSITAWKIFPSPNQFIKFPDFLYIRVVK